MSLRLIGWILQILFAIVVIINYMVFSDRTDAILTSLLVGMYVLIYFGSIILSKLEEHE